MHDKFAARITKNYSSAIEAKFVSDIAKIEELCTAFDMDPTEIVSGIKMGWAQMPLGWKLSTCMNTRSLTRAGVEIHAICFYSTLKHAYDEIFRIEISKLPPVSHITGTKITSELCYLKYWNDKYPEVSFVPQAIAMYLYVIFNHSPKYVQSTECYHDNMLFGVNWITVNCSHHISIYHAEDTVLELEKIAQSRRIPLKK
jgi:hypothetical protein